jgi:uncharacterized coiled-coil protein SlyX
MDGRMTYSGWLAVAGLFAAACGPTPEQQQQLAELPMVIAEKAQLQAEVDRLTAAMREIETELTNVTMIPAPTSEGGERASPPAAVGQLVAYVGEMEEQLTAAQTRLRSLNATSAGQVQRIAALEASIAEERAAMEGQRRRISSLEEAISGLEAETARQSEVNQQLERTVEEMTDDANTVWYVVGTKEELLDRGLIREEGGSRVLFIFGKRGQTLVPSRTLDPTLFTAADQRMLGSIPLPISEEEAKWTVVTPQDLSASGSPLDERGRVLGDVLSIADPLRFWANSRYLIVVRS